MNWSKIKNEYISDPSASYRKLSEKYGVARSTLSERAKKEGWHALKLEAAERAEAKLLETVGEENARIDGKFYKAVDLLLEEACKCLSAPGQLRAVDIKDISSALKNIKDLKGIKSELDLEEQRARISALKAKFTPEDDDNEGGGVIILSDVDLPPEGGETDG